jgi:3-oxoadipyl-CoA thiolase
MSNKNSNNAFVIDSVRTPVGKWGGTLSSIRPDDMAAATLKEIMKRNPNIPAEKIEDVILGCANGAGEDNRNVARMAVLLADLPVSIPGETVNRLCSSGLASIIHASRAIKLDEGDIFIAGGVESMTRAPYVMSKSAMAFGRDAKIYDTSIGWRFVNTKMDKIFGTEGMGETAENIAEMYKISREDQDSFALWSQQKATWAMESGRLAKEIMSVEIPQRKKDPIIFERDEFIRTNATIEGFEKLRPAFRSGGTVTAGNSSGINDGACAVLMAGDFAVSEYNLKPMSKIISSAVAGVEPRIMGTGPIEAANKALSRAGLSWDDIDIIELNEAFAAQALSCTRSWGLDDRDERINPNGGAIAIGHPLGMSGARLAGAASIELHEQDKQFAVVTMCVGVGQGFAAVVERV